jgi:hypothetical protein
VLACHGVSGSETVVSVRALEALQVIELLHKNDSAVDLSKLDPVILQRKLDYYRTDRLRNADRDAVDSLQVDRDLASLVSSVSARNSLELLLPLGFLYNRVYTNDPLFRLGAPTHEYTKAQNLSMGWEAETALDPSAVGNALRYFERLAPLVRSGVVTVLPLEELHAPPEEIPVFYSPDCFRSEVPAHIHDFVHRRAIVRELGTVPDQRGFVIYDHAPPTPTRGIAVTFADDFDPFGMQIYLLSQMEVLDRAKHHFRFSQKLDWNDPPDKATFDAWVYQSINRTIINRIQSVAREIGVSQRINATYLTESKFEAELCGCPYQLSAPGRERLDAVNFLNANFPYLKIDSAATLARLRGDNAPLFERWQRTLLAAAEQLNGCDQDFDYRAQQLFEKEIRPQVDELRRALTKAGGQVGGAALLTAGTIGMALLSNAALPFAAVLGLGALTVGGYALPTVTEYLSKRNGPAFLWSKLTK